MSSPVVCPSCGTALSIPAEYARSKIRCPSCGVFCAVPVDARREPAIAATPQDHAEAVTVEPVSPEPTQALKPALVPPWLSGTDEDDGQPYTVPGEPLQPAPPAPVRSRALLTAAWENGWALPTRIQVFIALAALNVLALLFCAVLLNNVAGAAFMLMCATAMLAFLVGTFDRVTLTRNSKGRVRLTRTWRIAFYELQPQTLHWSEYETLDTSKTYQVHFEDWVVLAILVPYALVPAMLWWWFVIRPVRYHVNLYKDHGYPDTVLFRTLNEELAVEVTQTVADVTGLPIKQEAEQARGGRMN